MLHEHLHWFDLVSLLGAVAALHGDSADHATNSSLSQAKCLPRDGRWGWKFLVLSLPPSLKGNRKCVPSDHFAPTTL